MKIGMESVETLYQILRVRDAVQREKILKDTTK